MSPNKLKITTVIKIAIPGAKITQGADCIILLPLLIIEPHSAVGGIAPKPKNESPASSIIITPISNAAVTAIVPKMLGKIYLNIYFSSEHPLILAACIH